jgi:hypothetical protein
MEYSFFEILCGSRGDGGQWTLAVFFDDVNADVGISDSVEEFLSTNMLSVDTFSAESEFSSLRSELKDVTMVKCDGGLYSCSFPDGERFVPERSKLNGFEHSSRYIYNSFYPVFEFLSER